MPYKMCGRCAELMEGVCDESLSYKADRPASKTHKAVVSVFDFDERSLTDGSLRVKLFDLGEITKEELLESLKYKKVTYQYCFKTKVRIVFILQHIFWLTSKSLCLSVYH